MNRSIALKFLAFLLAACALVTAIGSLAGIAILGAEGLYDVSLNRQLENRLQEQGKYLGEQIAGRYASENLGGCPEAILDALYGSLTPHNIWSVTLSLDGEVLLRQGDAPAGSYQVEFTANGIYYAMPDARYMAQESVGIALQIWEDGQRTEYILSKRNLPAYTVQVRIHPDYVTGSEWPILTALYSYRYQLIFLAVASLLILAACIVYLCWAAGRSPDSEKIRPGGLSRLPLDLHGLIVGVILYFGLRFGAELADWTFRDGINNAGFFLGGLLAVVLSLIALAFCYALAAQLKARGGYWWRNSLTGRCLRLLYRGSRRICRWLAVFFSLLPVIWQWLLVTGVMAGGTLAAFLLAVNRGELFVFLFFAMAIGCVGVVCYGGWCFGVLLSGVRKMNRGKLEHQIPTKYLFGSFRDFAQDLNALSGCAVEAARKQLKSERMKTELITNVSHDIKTPLTSIINYVDLLQKPHSNEEQAQYLEVLSRQSLALKKLIDDLMELSKANTGNLTVDIGPVDAAEAINQALGEFSGKFAAAGLIPVFDPPPAELTMLADGRLVWRVLSNLLGNAVKYALPGTRVYLDAARLEDQVMISVKNISRERLSVSAEELMERFVRGDASRNTEGSGLGLNIAKSLTEIQRGQFRLLVDGDLFKVTLFFPLA